MGGVMAFSNVMWRAMEGWRKKRIKAATPAPPSPEPQISNKRAQISNKRRFPNALIPTHVFRADGGHMDYRKWLNSRHTEITGMRFEDGSTVGVCA